MRLGLYGGTFDPIHDAHLAVAEAARRAFDLERVLLIPNRYPPHKEAATGAPYADRLRMVELGCEGWPGLQACDIENHDGKSYTIETLEQLRGMYPTAEFYFLIGADAFAEVMTWKRVQEVFERTEFIVAARPGFAYAVPAGARVHRLERMQFRESSTAIREQLEHGEAPLGVPAEVAGYISERRLYRERGQVRTA